MTKNDGEPRSWSMKRHRIERTKPKMTGETNWMDSRCCDKQLRAKSWPSQAFVLTFLLFVWCYSDLLFTETNLENRSSNATIHNTRADRAYSESKTVRAKHSSCKVGSTSLETTVGANKQIKATNALSTFQHQNRTTVQGWHCESVRAIHISETCFAPHKMQGWCVWL